METWKHLRAILLLPFMVTVVIPGTILWLTGPDTLELWRSGPAARVGLLVLGGEVTRPETLRGLCEGIEVVFSSIGITRLSSMYTGPLTRWTTRSRWRRSWRRARGGPE